jgi:hypothetical protein
MNIIYVGKNKYIYCQNKDIICIILAHMLMKQITKQQNEIENLCFLKWLCKLALNIKYGFWTGFIIEPEPVDSWPGHKTFDFQTESICDTTGYTQSLHKLHFDSRFGY